LSADETRGGESMTDTAVRDDLDERRLAKIMYHIDVEAASDLEGWRASFAPGRVSYHFPCADLLFGEELSEKFCKTIFSATRNRRGMNRRFYFADDDTVTAEVEFHYDLLTKSESGEETWVPMVYHTVAIFRFEGPNGDDMWQESVYGGTNYEALLEIMRS
jgi:hypothetical protein